MSDAFSYTEQDGLLVGPERAPRNSARHLGAGSIHDDATAQKLGFRGGTVAGSLHMEQFPPLLIESFGDRWLKTGGLSLYFKYATTDGEPVRAFARRAETGAAIARTDVWMDDSNDNRVCDGTANVGGPDPESTVRQRIAAMPEPRDIRILANLVPGFQGPSAPSRITEDALDQRLAVITEPLAAYTDDNIYGHRIATPALQVQVLRPAEPGILPRDSSFGVGLFGAIELQLFDGPVFVEYDYETQARILAVGETPKTEYLYYEAVLSDATTDTEVLKMIMMLRFMKASSKLWAGSL